MGILPQLPNRGDLIYILSRFSENLRTCDRVSYNVQGISKAVSISTGADIQLCYEYSVEV